MVLVERLFMRLIKGSLAGLVLTGILASMPALGLMGQTTVHIAQAPVGAYASTKAPTESDSANLRHIATAENPNRLAARQNLLDQDRFIQMPQSSGRYNFQFSDNEIRSVQAALRRLGIYSGQVDGILGPDTHRAIEDYQVKNKLPVTGQPDRGLNALLGLF